MILDDVLYGALGLCLVAFLGSLVRMGLAQREFFRLHDERNSTGRPLSSERLTGYYVDHPSRWFRDSPGLAGRSFDALLTPQSDPTVEQARRRAARRSLVPFAVLLLMIAVLFVPWHNL